MNSQGVINIEPDSSVYNGSSSQDAIEIVDDEDQGGLFIQKVHIMNRTYCNSDPIIQPGSGNEAGKYPFDVINASNAKQVLNNLLWRKYYDSSLSCRSCWFLEFTWLQYIRASNLLSCIYCSQTTSNGSLAVGRDPLKTRRIDLVVHSQTDTHIQIAEHFTSGKDTSANVITVQSSSKFCNLRKILLKKKTGTKQPNANSSKELTFIDVTREFNKNKITQSTDPTTANHSEIGIAGTSVAVSNTLGNNYLNNVSTIISPTRQQTHSTATKTVAQILQSTNGPNSCSLNANSDNTVGKCKMFPNSGMFRNFQSHTRNVIAPVINLDSDVQKPASNPNYPNAVVSQNHSARKKKAYNQPQLFTNDVLFKMIKDDGNKKRVEFLMSHFKLRLNWFTEFKWLEFKTGTNRFFCKYCRLHNTSSIFAKGKFAMAIRSKRSDFLIHMETDMHKHVMMTSKFDNNIHGNAVGHSSENYVQHMSNMTARLGLNSTVTNNVSLGTTIQNNYPPYVAQKPVESGYINMSSSYLNNGDTPVKIEKNCRKNRNNSTLIVIQPEQEETSKSPETHLSDTSSPYASNVNVSQSEESMEKSLSDYLQGNNADNLRASSMENVSSPGLNNLNLENSAIAASNSSNYYSSESMNENEDIDVRLKSPLKENPIAKLCHVVDSYTCGNANGTSSHDTNSINTSNCSTVIRKNRNKNDGKVLVIDDNDDAEEDINTSLIRNENIGFNFTTQSHRESSPEQNENTPSANPIEKDSLKAAPTSNSTEKNNSLISINNSECHSTHSVENDLATLQSRVVGNPELHSSNTPELGKSEMKSIETCKSLKSNFATNLRQASSQSENQHYNGKKLQKTVCRSFTDQRGSVSVASNMEMPSPSVSSHSSITKLHSNQNDSSINQEKYYPFHETFWPIASYMRQQNTFCDVTVAAFSSDGSLVKFPVHKLILACASDYLKEKFSSPQPIGKMKTFVFPNITSKGLKGVVDFLYGQNVSGDSAFYRECYQAAWVLGVSSAETIFNNLISTVCSQQEVFEITMGLPCGMTSKCLVEPEDKKLVSDTDYQHSLHEQDNSNLRKSKKDERKVMSIIKKSPKSNSSIASEESNATMTLNSKRHRDKSVDSFDGSHSDEPENKKYITEYRFLSRTPPHDTSDTNNIGAKEDVSKKKFVTKIVNVKCYICRRHSKIAIIDRAVSKNLRKPGRNKKKIGTNPSFKKCPGCVRKLYSGPSKINCKNKIL